MKNTDEIKLRWISTDEQQAPIGNMVLILFEELYINNTGEGKERFVNRLTRSVGMFTEDGWMNMYPRAVFLEHCPVRYWMPLPPYDYEQKSPNTNKKTRQTHFLKKQDNG